MFKLIVLLALVAAVVGQGTRVQVRPCPGGHTEPYFFESEFCSTTRCSLIRDQFFTGFGEWTTHRHFARLDVTIQATWLGIGIDMPLTPEESNACLTTRGGCPIAAGSRNHWTIHFHVLQGLPAGIPVVITSKFKYFHKETICLNFSLLLSLSWRWCCWPFSVRYNRCRHGLNDIRRLIFCYRRFYILPKIKFWYRKCCAIQIQGYTSFFVSHCDVEFSSASSVQVHLWCESHFLKSFQNLLENQINHSELSGFKWMTPMHVFEAHPLPLNFCTSCGFLIRKIWSKTWFDSLQPFRVTNTAFFSFVPKIDFRTFSLGVW